MAKSKYPLLFQVNTRVWLTELSRKAGRKMTLNDIPDDELDRLSNKGFDWIWLLSVWQTGQAGQQVSRTHPEWRREFEKTLPDLRDEDIAGSGFAITSYHVHSDLGGDNALAKLRKRLRQRGLLLMLDFVPNHTGLDHTWLTAHPEYYMHGSEEELTKAPGNYIRINTGKQDFLLAHGRDPNFAGWPDTLQLNYADPAMQQAMAKELLRIAGQCDGVRCDMAMLVLPEIFARTWGLHAQPFWPQAIQQVRESFKDFCFMAEVYWDYEWAMLQQGFDYAYDKRLYDRLRDRNARAVREHFYAGPDFQDHLARFLENHDEPRAADVFPENVHEAAAVLSFLSPGLHFFHQGQFQGYHKHISPHLVRGPEEPVNPAIKGFYDQLLDILQRPVIKSGEWKLLECQPAWDGNGTFENFIAFMWQDPIGNLMLICVNYAPYAGQCYVRLSHAELNGQQWCLHDLLSDDQYDRDGNDLHLHGLYLDAPAWHIHIFEFVKPKTTLKRKKRNG